MVATRSERVVRVGMVGAGLMARVHTAAWTSNAVRDAGYLVNCARLAARRPGVARAESALCPWSEIVDDWTRVTRAHDVDLVDVVAPNSIHVPVASDALAHGKHVTCEKPLAPDVDGAVHLAARASETSLVTHTAFILRCWPAVKEAKRLLDGKRIGSPRQLRAWSLQNHMLIDPDQPWRRDVAVSGGGVATDLGSHVVDLAQLLMGRISHVTARMDRAEDGVEDAAELLVEFACGARGLLEVGWAHAGHRLDMGFEVVGTDGAIRACWGAPGGIELCDEPTGSFSAIGAPSGRAGSEATSLEGELEDLFAAQALDVLRALDGRPVSLPSFETGAQVAQVIAAAMRSHDSEARVVVMTS